MLGIYGSDRTTKNEDISYAFEVAERKTLAVQNIVDKNKYLTILFYSQHYTHLDTCPKHHPAGYIRVHISCLRYIGPDKSFMIRRRVVQNEPRNVPTILFKYTQNMISTFDK